MPAPTTSETLIDGYTIRYDADAETYDVYDPEGDCCDSHDTLAEAIETARETARDAAIGAANDALADAELEEVEAQAEVDRLVEELAEARRELKARKADRVRAERARDRLDG